jgi:hypothetical protein
MVATPLEQVAEAVVRRAQRQGFILPGEIREELTRVGVAETLWKEVVALARSALHYQGGRYHYQGGVSERVREEQDQQRRVQRAVRQVIRRYRQAAQAALPTVQRRRQDRIDFVQPVRVQTEDGRTLTLLSRDVSSTGIRLLGTSRLLGQKIRVWVPPPTPATGEGWSFLVRILWTCAVADELFENGGNFLAAE